MAVKASAGGGWQLEDSLLRRVGDEARLAPLGLDDGDCFASVTGVVIDGKLTLCSKPRHGQWFWFAIEPGARDYDNTPGCLPVTPGCTQPIAYSRKEIVSLRGRGEVSAVELDELLGLGTHWITTTLSASVPSSAMSWDKGRPAGFEFVVRRDNGYTGYLTELLGVPFVYLPSLTPEGKHQTDLRLGADCVALVVYGQRRLGKKVPYMAPPALSRFTSLVAPTASGVVSVMKGDILDFGFQTAVISADRGRIGFLDDEDSIIHTYHGYAEEVVFSSLPYQRSPFKIRRWNSAR